MSKISTALLFALVFQLSSNAQQNQVDSIIRDADVCGIQLIHVKNGREQDLNAGTISDKSPVKVNSATIFEAASLSKSVFAYIVLRLSDRGIINLDSPLLRYIGTYWRFDPKDPAFGKITARMVLRHTTGLPNWGADSSVHLIFPPDSCFSYSGEGYWFLQTVIEKKLNKSLNEIAIEEVFVPLNMTSSSYVWNSKFEKTSSFPPTRENIEAHSRANAAFSLLTNAHDYTIFLDALMNGKGLKPETQKLMFSEASAANRFNEKENNADPFIAWGLGVGLQKNEKGKSVWHWGDNGAYKCFYMAYPDQHESLVYFTHSQNGMNIASELTELFFGAQTCWVMKWLTYGYDSPLVIKAFRTELTKAGYNHASEIITAKKKNDPGFNITEKDLNNLGYLLMGEGKTKEALEIFKVNTALYPGSWNVYDSQAEAHENLNEKDLAIQYYRRSIELNPGNENAKAHLQKLEGQK